MAPVRWPKLPLLVVFLVTATACAGRTGTAEGEPAGVPDPLPAGRRVAARIAPAGLLEDTNALSSDAFEGRFPGSEGDRLARAQLAWRLEDAGCEPGFEGRQWEQPFEIVGITAHMPERWTFVAPDGREESFRFRDEFVGGSGVQDAEVAFETAEVVFVGYGIRAPEQQWDDFKGADLRGKVLLMLNDDPDWDPELFAGPRKLYYGRWTYKYESAAREGAAGAIIVHTAPSAGYPWQVVRNSWGGEQFELPAGGEPRAKLHAWLTEDAAGRLVALAGQDLAALVAQARSREFRPVPLGVRTSIRVANDVRSARTANVAGILTGRDPDLAREVVIYSAHHDHLGTGEPDATGDVIYNGALDNGVAMAQVLAVAEAFAALPERPARSVMFLFPAAEEQSLLGSKHFAASGRFHPGRIAADINFELGSVWGPTRDVVVYGMGKSSLEDLLAAEAARAGRTVGPEGDPRAGWYYRSDQFSFAKIGVPSIWFRGGTDVIGKPEGWGKAAWEEWIATRYHRPSDEVSADWNLEGLADDARLGFLLGLSVAETPSLPAWHPGDEFEGARKTALAALGGVVK